MIVLSDPFVYVWVYEVSPESSDAFRELYGPNGPWVDLFRRAPGYLGTELLADRNRQGRFVTVDRWESEQAFSDFRSMFAAEFDRLDRQGEELTVRETLLGEFEPVEGSG